MPGVHEVRPGLWWWTSVHPEWDEEESSGADWGPEVSSYAFDDGARLILVDPTALPEPVAALAADREVAILLTNHWHERDAPALAASHGASVHAPPVDGPGRMDAEHFVAGDELPFDLVAFDGREPPLDVLLWFPAHRAVVIGDTLIDRGDGIELVDSWLADGVTREQVIDGLRPLLELPVEHVLPTHGEPTDRAALERALAR